MPLMRHNKKMKSHFFIVILNDYPDVILNDFPMSF